VCWSGRRRAAPPPGRSFDHAGLTLQIQDCRRLGFASGPAGFGTKAQISAVLLPNELGQRPMVLGFVHAPDERIAPADLIALLQKSVQACADPSGAVSWLPAPMVSSAA
jgi:hypothetical protein